MIRAGYLADGILIAAEAGTSFNPASDRVIARIEEGRLLGGVTYVDYTGVSIGMHVAGFDPRWLNKEMLWAAFDYPFNQLNCHCVFGQIPSDNLKALEFDAKIGFKEVTRIPDVFPNADLVVMRMYRDDCRWLKLGARYLKG